MSLGTVNCPTVFAKTHYDKLPQGYKDLLESLKPGAYVALEESYAAKDVVNEKKWSAPDSKVKMITIPDSEMAEFRRIAGKPVWDAWVKDNADKFNSQELLDTVLNIAK